MYRQIKLALKSILPESLLFGLEPLMRQLYALPFKGGEYHCPICNTDLKKWIPINEAADNLCPACGSIARTRLMTELHLAEPLRLDKQSWSVLHFSPSRALKRLLRKYPKLEYVTTDYESKYEDHNYDITSIPEPDDRFDLIICFHVLEHIPDDRKAMEELFRIIKPGGTILLQTPFQEGATYEDLSITSEAEREKHFGQKDHVRIYGFDDFVLRLEAVGFKINRKKASQLLSDETLRRLALKGESVVVFASK